MMLLAHHEALIVVEYSLFAGGSAIWFARQWWRSRRTK